MVDKRCGGGLAVRSGYAYHLRACIASSELYLADDVYALLHCFLYHGSLLRDAGALYYLVGGEDFLFRVLLFLPLDGVVVEQLLVLVLDG